MKSPTQSLFDRAQSASGVNSSDESSFIGKLFKAVKGSEKDVYTVVKSLATAVSREAAIEIPFAFKGFYITKIRNTVSGDIDNDAEVKIILEKNVKGVDELICQHNFSYNSEAAYNKAFLYFEAFADCEVTIQFFRFGSVQNGVVHTQSNVHLVSQETGFVVDVKNYLATTLTRSNPALAAATATLLSAYSDSKRSVTIQNKSGAVLYIGEGNTITNAGATKGYELGNGESVVFDSRVAIWGYSFAGFAAGAVVILTESV